MLQSASKGKEIPEKQLIILGGTPEQQKDFLDQVNPPADHTRLRYQQTRRRQQQQQQQREVPNSNKYALGYTYHDVLDTDEEDVLARLNVYTLSSSASALGSLLRPLLNVNTVRNTLISIVLDWSEPWKWTRQLRHWIRMLRRVVATLDEETKIEMEDAMNARKEKRASGDIQPISSDPKVAVQTSSLGPGEWDELLGILLNVVCIRSEKIEDLERQHQWQEDHLDYIQQWLRTVLLKHGATLCYVTSFDSNNVRTLIHTSLNIESSPAKQKIHSNVIDRDKILVPSNWDSWGKIRASGQETFDTNTISERWSIEIQAQPETKVDFTRLEPDDTAVYLFERLLPRRPDPSEMEETDSKVPPPINIKVPSHQDFLLAQKATLDKLVVDDEREHSGPYPDTTGHLRSQITAQIGAYNINVNGIDVDAEEATRRLRERETERTGRRDGTPTRSGKNATIDSKENDTAAYAAFFGNLINKGKGGKSGTGSGINSPRRDSPSSTTMNRMGSDRGSEV